MQALFHAILVLVPLVAFFVCIVWLLCRAYKDGAIHDVVLLLTGFSILAYVISRWDRAKRPLAGMVGAIVLFVLVAIALSGTRAPAHARSAEELAVEVKRLIQDDWRTSPTLREAAIRNISLVPEGQGLYTGYVNVTIDGHAQRFALEVVLDQQTIQWKLKTEAN